MALNVKEKIDSVVTPDLKRKVAAWWQGVDVDDLEGALQGQGPVEVDMTPDAPVEPAVEIDMSHFIKISEMLWGEGYVTPGGKSFIDLWGQQLSLNKEKSTAFVGGGLGGQARELNLSTGSWVTCFERHPELIEVSTGEAMMAGLAKKVECQHYDPENMDLGENKFNAIVAKEEFTSISNKQGAIDAVASGLKSSGLFMFTEYVSMSEDIPPERLTEIFGTMRGESSLWSEEQYVGSLENANLGIHVNEELSDTYVTFINEAWGNYQSVVKQIRNSDDSDMEKAALLRMVGVSAEEWTHIAMALQSGEIQLRRFLARKD